MGVLCFYLMTDVIKQEEIWIKIWQKKKKKKKKKTTKKQKKQQQKNKKKKKKTTKKQKKNNKKTKKKKHIKKNCNRVHYENKPIQIYTNFYQQKKNSDIVHISAQNINCGYPLEPPRRGGSKEYPKSMFWTSTRNLCFEQK